MISTDPLGNGSIIKCPKELISYPFIDIMKDDDTVLINDIEMLYGQASEVINTSRLLGLDMSNVSAICDDGINVLLDILEAANQKENRTKKNNGDPITIWASETVAKILHIIGLDNVFQVEKAEDSPLLVAA